MINKNWHAADIIASLKKKGTTLAEISRAAGLSSSTLSNALSRPWPKGEQLIAQELSLPPSTIWPERYFDEKGNQIIRKTREQKINDRNKE